MDELLGHTVLMLLHIHYTFTLYPPPPNTIIFRIILIYIPVIQRIFKGFLVATDGYMNLQLASTEEYMDGNCTGNLGEVLVRYLYCIGYA